tara:strand:- start:1222 stop:2361 length:1140 start_codon:yes stop_codon:yes gene_type:complete
LKKILLPIIISIFIIEIISNISDSNFDNIALGRHTSTYVAKHPNGHIIHSTEDQTILNNLASRTSIINDNHLELSISLMYDDWIRRGKRDIIFLIGNSQYHAINNLKSGDINTSEILFNYFEDHSIDFLTYSSANMNLQEQYLMMDYFFDIFPIKYLLLPVFLDDTREDGIRFYVKDLLLNKVKNENNDIIYKKLFSKNSDSPAKDLEGLSDTAQEIAENYFNKILLENSENWSSRANVRNMLFSQLYLLRNKVFNINPSTARKVIPGPYRDNLFSLEKILINANKRKIETLVYIPPIRNDVQIPYLTKEYSQFKDDIRSISSEHNSNFVNYENILLNEYWGYKGQNDNKEIDFMHFNYQGHQALADSLYDYITNKIIK